MTRLEWAEICQRVAAWWPHQQWPDASAAAYFDDLNHLPAAQVLAGVQTLYLDGREFPPNGAQILAQVADLDRNAPSFGEAWRLMLECSARHSFVYEPEAAASWLDAQHPLIGRWAREIGLRDLGMAEDGDTTFQAQCRRKWDVMVRRDRREATWSGVALDSFAGVLRSVNGEPLAEIEDGE